MVGDYVSVEVIETKLRRNFWAFRGSNLRSPFTHGRRTGSLDSAESGRWIGLGRLTRLQSVTCSWEKAPSITTKSTTC